MGDVEISLEDAINIIRSKVNSEIVSKDYFYLHLERFGLDLMADYYQNKEDNVDTIIYRSVLNNDIVAFSMGNDCVEYRTVNIQTLY